MDDMIIDFRLFWKYASITNIRRKFKFNSSLSKITFDKKNILNNIILLKITK